MEENNNRTTQTGGELMSIRSMQNSVKNTFKGGTKKKTAKIGANVYSTSPIQQGLYNSVTSKF